MVGVRARRGSFDTGSFENSPHDRASVSALHEGSIPIGASSYFNVARGLAYARPANTTPETKVIDTSLCADPPEEPQLLADEVAAIKAAGKILVDSAHNDNSSATTGGCRYPGSDPNTALRVTATEENDCRAFFSNFSPASNPT